MASALAFALAVVGGARGASAQAAAGAYPTMAPREQYMMDKAAEVALARSAAVAALSGGASVMALGAHGFEAAAMGATGFTCLVERAGDKPFNDAEFWNPKSGGQSV